MSSSCYYYLDSFKGFILVYFSSILDEGLIYFEIGFDIAGGIFGVFIVVSYSSSPSISTILKISSPFY